MLQAPQIDAHVLLFKYILDSKTLKMLKYYCSDQLIVGNVRSLNSDGCLLLRGILAYKFTYMFK